MVKIERTVTIKVPTGKIREEPRPDGPVLVELEQGQKLELLEHQRRYSQVRYQDRFQNVTGWIANVAVNLPDSQRQAEQTPPTCPFCSGDSWVDKGIRTHNSSLMVGGSFFSAHYAYSRICLGCGYVQLYVSADALRQLQAENE